MKQKRRKASSTLEPIDVFIDTLCWIHDGRRSWNRKPRKDHPAEMETISTSTGKNFSGPPDEAERP